MWLNKTKENFLTYTFSQKQKNIAQIILFVTGMLVIASTLSSFIWLRLQHNKIRANAAKVQTLLTKDPINALVLAIYTTGQNKRLKALVPWQQISIPVQSSLRQAIDLARESDLLQHAKSVHSVAFSPSDGQIIVSGGDGGMRLWSEDGKQINQTLLEEDVDSVAFSPDGKTIAAVINEQTIRLLDRTGQFVQSFSEHNSEIASVAFSPKGKYLLTGSKDNTVRLWDLDGNLILTLRGHEGQVNAVTFSPNGENIFSGSYQDGKVNIWDLDGNLEQTFPIGKNIITSLAVSPDGQTLVLGGEDSIVRLWNIDSNLVQNLSGHQKKVSSVAYNPDGQTFISSSLDETIRIWSRDGSLIQVLRGHEGNINSVAFSPKGKKIISGSQDSTVRFWQGGNWEDWLATGCNQLQAHPIWKNPETREAKGAKKTCKQYISDTAEQSEDKQLETNNPSKVDNSEPQTPTVTPEDFSPTPPEIAQDYYHRGMEQADLKLIQNFTKVIENPNSSNSEKTDAYINRGVIYFREKKYALAIDDYTKAASIASNDQKIHAYVNRGIAYSSLAEHQYELAIADYNQAINIDPNYADAYINRGIALSSLGKYPQAVENFNKAIALDPDHADTHYARGFALALENKQAEAIEAYQKAVELYRQQGKEEYSQSALKKIEELKK